MVNGLILLVTQRALILVREITACQSISCPAVIVGGQPQEEATFVRCRSFPNALTWIEGDGPLKQHPIC
jgi:hypothetical protein